MNSTGDRVAIGANGNDGTGINAGHVRIYEYSSGSWTQLGADIDGEAAGDQSGYSVSMNAAGDRVAIGALAMMVLHLTRVTCASISTHPVLGLSLVVTSMGKPRMTTLALPSP